MPTIIQGCRFKGYHWKWLSQPFGVCLKKLEPPVRGTVILSKELVPTGHSVHMQSGTHTELVATEQDVNLGQNQMSNISTMQSG